MATRFLAGVAIVPGIFLVPPHAYAGGIVIVQKSAETVKAGKSVPIYNAIKEIAPPEYSVVMGEGISPDEKVSWPAGGDWMETLNKLHADSGATYGVTPHGHDLLLRNLDVAADTPAGSSQPGGGPIVIGSRSPVTSPGVTFLTAPRPAPPSPPIPSPPPIAAPATPPAPSTPAPPPANTTLPSAANRGAPPPSVRLPNQATTPINEDMEEASSGQVWHATGGKYLSDIIEDWAEKAGWQVVYDTRMLYEVSADSDFEGSFPHAAWTMIHQMQQQIKMAGAEKPFPDIYFWKNRTAVIVTHRGLQD
ncbi:TcpQ domain-containing protein [Acetobacter malorum]|uniref:TcpQ domain-containing protein n=1 Tax=Acetobacter malorum TaxID=178901 RepID=UPI000776CC19|nr:TcpQ domain-containing protein [Acetobacter malorum]KXV05634.1 hypothetical protein AD930_10870 [Acetobacter malorum]